MFSTSVDVTHCHHSKMADTMEEKSKLSFTFSKRINSKTLQDSQLRHESTKDDIKRPDYVLSVSGDHILSTVAKPKKHELIIPLIVKNNWRLPSTASGSNVKSDSQATTLEKQAIDEILKDTQRFKEEVSEKENGSNLVIPVMIQNKIPDGFETDDKVDVSLRAEEATLEDYDQVPIEDYGLAMIKGMGWKPTEGIGATNKKVVKPLETTLRPKGLGLGAGVKSNSDTKSTKEEVGSIELGAYVKITHGPHKACYGQVAGFDVDNSRVMIALSLNSQTVTVNEFYVEVVSKQEYKKESKVINKAKYDEYNESRSQRKEEPTVSKKEEPYRHSSHNREKKHYSSFSEDEKDRKKIKSERQESTRKSVKSWVQPLLRVRFIEKSYKNGKYYNTKVTLMNFSFFAFKPWFNTRNILTVWFLFSLKVIIEDVCKEALCICRTQSGHILEDISESWLETLIPKEQPYIVMVVKGSYKGQLGKIVDKDRKNYTARVQLLQDKDVVKLHYDSICEYCGTVSDYL